MGIVVYYCAVERTEELIYAECFVLQTKKERIMVDSGNGDNGSKGSRIILITKKFVVFKKSLCTGLKDCYKGVMGFVKVISVLAFGVGLFFFGPYVLKVIIASVCLVAINTRYDYMKDAVDYIETKQERADIRKDVNKDIGEIRDCLGTFSLVAPVISAEAFKSSTDWRFKARVQAIFGTYCGMMGLWHMLDEANAKIGKVLPKLDESVHRIDAAMKGALE